MKKLDHLKNIFNNYDHFIIDLWGVVHNGIKPYEGAIKTIEELYNNNKNYGDYCDSLTFCFSKALGAPIGSMLLGSKEFIKEAREYRKKLGGGMRQVGVIASMANTALENRESILEDHTKAKKVYEFLSQNFNKRKIDSIVYKGTNMIFLNVNEKEDPNKLIKIFHDNSINAGLKGEKSVRLVFHKDIHKEEIDEISKKLIHSSSEF